MRLDHLSYVAGAEGLGACMQRLGSKLGAPFSDGGIHPSFGTRNVVLPLDDMCYLEIVAPLDHPAVERAPFGRAVRDRAASGGGWLAWALRVDDIGPVEQRLGRPAAAGHRRRPDGFDLKWRQIGLNDVSEDPQLPFFTHWDVELTQHPAAIGSSIRLTGLEIAGIESAVDAYVGAPARGAFGDLDVEWISPFDGDHGLLAATFATPHGDVRID